jgi:glycosyltransferase involved in cell wall biosynthesis
VTIVVPTRDRARVIRRTVDSIAAQSFRDWELIVVDDGSSDNTAAIVRAHGDPRVRCEVKGPPHGCPNARNHGAALARGRFIAFQDSGDEWHPDKLAVQVEAMARLPESVAMVYSSLTRVFPDGREQRLDCPVFKVGEAGRYERALAMGVSGIYPQTALIRAAAFRSLGGFDERLRSWEDLEFFIRLAKSWDLHFVPGHFTRLHEDSRGVSLNFDGMKAAHLTILEKHAADFAERPEALVPHWRGAGRQLIQSRHGEYAREILWKAARSPQSRPADWAWLLLSYGGAPAYRAAAAARRLWWRVAGLPALDTGGSLAGGKS